MGEEEVVEVDRGELGDRGPKFLLTHLANQTQSKKQSSSR